VYVVSCNSPFCTSAAEREVMERVHLHPPAPPMPPLLHPMRRAVPDYQGLDFPVESDCSPVSSDDESEYYVSNNEYDNCTDDEGEGYDSELESDNSISEVDDSISFSEIRRCIT